MEKAYCIRLFQKKQPQNIKVVQIVKNFFLKKEKGELSAFLALFLIVIGIMCLFYTNTKSTISQMKVICEDALVSSTLASAIVDIEEYGRTGSITIADYSECYRGFKKSLDDNLKLNAQNESSYTVFFASPIEVTDFIIYNVSYENGTIDVITGDGNSIFSQYEANLGTTYAPDGTLINNTSIYSKIKFDVRLTNTTEVPADKGCCVDITDN